LKNPHAGGFIMAEFDVREYNRRAWNKLSEQGNRYTQPASPQVIAAARSGDWQIHLTPTIPIPASWFPRPIAGKAVLCLASGGGQQGPILAAAGVQVTVYDNSPVQLSRDREVAEREGLDLHTVEGDMRDLAVFPNDCFDLIVHPVSNVFVPEVRPVWQEAYRVLRPGGALLAGFNNPLYYLFDIELLENERRLEVRYPLPYSDLEQLSPAALEKFIAESTPLEFSHTLDEQIGGQIAAGFWIGGFYEDHNLPEDDFLLDEYFPVYIATRAVKPPVSA
jgi:SAM-dependent methyltransferase